MRRSKILVVFGIIFTIGLMSNIINVSASVISSSSYATADTHINSNDSVNYGQDGELLVGNIWFTAFYYRSYITFDLSAIPSNFIKAEISLYFVIVPMQMNLNVNLADSNWGETSLNGSSCTDEFTAVIDGAFITTLTIGAVGSQKILVTDYIEGKTALSINLEPVDNLTNTVIEIYSKEEDILRYKPKITWTYEDNTINPAIIAGFVILGIFGIAGVGFFIYKKKGSSTIRPISEPDPFSTRRARKSDKICWYCEKPIPKSFNVCPSCGAELE